MLLPLLIVIFSGLIGMLLARPFVRHGTATTVGAQVRESPATAAPSATDTDSTVSAASGAVAQAGDANVAAPSATAGTPGAVTEDQEIQLVLHRWETALLSNDSQQIAAAYASHLERYFLQTNVTNTYVQAYLQGEESRGWRLTAYDVRNVRIRHVSPNEVDVEFIAGYAVTTGTGGRAGSAHTILKLRPEDGDWKIFYERDLIS